MESVKQKIRVPGIDVGCRLKLKLIWVRAQGLGRSRIEGLGALRLKDLGFGALGGAETARNIYREGGRKRLRLGPQAVYMYHTPLHVRMVGLQADVPKRATLQASPSGQFAQGALSRPSRASFTFQPLNLKLKGWYQKER